MTTYKISESELKKSVKIFCPKCKEEITSIVVSENKAGIVVTCNKCDKEGIYDSCDIHELQKKVNIVCKNCGVGIPEIQYDGCTNVAYFRCRNASCYLFHEGRIYLK